MVDQIQPPLALQRKLSRLIADPQSSESELWSKDLCTLATRAILPTNTPTTRRILRSSIEREIIASHVRFAEEAAVMGTAVAEVEDVLRSLQGLCERMGGVLEAREGEVGRVLDEIRGLEREIEVTEARKGWLEEYQGSYQLSAETIQVLKRGSEPRPGDAGASSTVVLDDAFFEALKRVQDVYANCKSLGLSPVSTMSTMSGVPDPATQPSISSTTALKGLQLVEHLSKLQDEAFRHVCSWVQAECQRIESPDDVRSREITEMMPKAMKCLRARPPLYSYCAEEIAIARKTAVYQKFIQALSQGARPIESHSGDPWRYASDMLAWIHASIAGEMELIGVLFEGSYGGKLSRRDTEGESDGNGDANNQDRLTGDAKGASGSHGDIRLSLQDIMDTIFEGVCRPLKRRLEQILLAAPSPVLNFQLTTLLSFYIKTVSPVMGDSSNLSTTLCACRLAAEKNLMDQMKQRGERLVRQPPMPTGDLGFPASHGPFADRLDVGLRIVEFYDGNFLVDDDDDDHRAADTEDDAPSTRQGDGNIDTLLDAIISPLVDAVFASADALNPTSSVRLDDSGSTMNPSKQHIYIINCLCHIRDKFRPYRSAAALCRRLIARMDGETERLVRIQTGVLLQVPEKRVGETGGTAEGFDALQAADLDAVWMTLSSGTTPVTEHLYPHGLVDAGVRNDVAQGIVTRVLDAYVRAYHRCAMSPTGATDGAAGTRLHTPEEIESRLRASLARL